MMPSWLPTFLNVSMISENSFECRPRNLLGLSSQLQGRRRRHAGGVDVVVSSRSQDREAVKVAAPDPDVGDPEVESGARESSLGEESQSDTAAEAALR